LQFWVLGFRFVSGQCAGRSGVPGESRAAQLVRARSWLWAAASAASLAARGAVCQGGSGKDSCGNGRRFGSLGVPEFDSALTHLTHGSARVLSRGAPCLAAATEAAPGAAARDLPRAHPRRWRPAHREDLLRRHCQGGDDCQEHPTAARSCSGLNAERVVSRRCLRLCLRVTRFREEILPGGPRGNAHALQTNAPRTARGNTQWGGAALHGGKTLTNFEFNVM